ncbi:putative sulfate transporter 3.5 [Tasmannia lanceolata]|uniref:putative sulfate transporter 3.5 n=1 Tax=Tasmannia lanceolata TaxID=3420 RepID=UPI004063EE79
MGNNDEYNHSVTVNFSNTRSFETSFKSSLKETFFPDDPFRQFKNQSALGKVGKVIKYFLPVLEWGPKYRLNLFRYDLLSGITIASLAIPQGISYAKLANLPPIIGLYSSFVPPLIYALFGTSRHLAVGTVAAASLLAASIIQKEVSFTEDPDLYQHLFFTAAFFSGVFQAALGIFRLGILVDFLSRPTILGFMGGTAIIIILQQLKSMLGLTYFTTKTDIVSVMEAIFSQTSEWRWESVVLGLGFLALLLFTTFLRKRQPKLFWVSAISPMLVVVMGCLIAYFADAEKHGIHIVGHLKKGINPSSLKLLNFDSRYLPATLKAGLLTGTLALTEGIAIGRIFAVMKNYHVDGNKEMIAFGMMNIVGSFTSCYLTTGPFSKSAVNCNSGSKTQMSNVVMSICMMLTLLFLAPLFSYTPLVALAAIITNAMLGLIEYREAYHVFKVDKFDFLICMAAFIGVVFFSMIVGLMMSVGLSIIRALLYVARPGVAKLGNVPNTSIYRDVEQYNSMVGVPSMLILQLGSPIYFANAGYIRERITRWVEEEDEKNINSKGDDLQFIILDLSGVTSIDKTGIDMLNEVLRRNERRGIKVAFTNPRIDVAEKFVASDLLEKTGKEWVFLSVREAISSCNSMLQESKEKEVARLQGHCIE